MSEMNIFVLIDALGWQFLDGRDFLTELLPYRRPLRTVLGFSSGAIPTILTGVPPANHGHWNLFYYDPTGSPFKWLRHFRFLPDALLDSRVGRKIVKELGRRALGMGPNFECCVSPRLMPHFNWVEKRDIYHEGGVGGAPSIFDQLAERHVPYRVYTYHDCSDAEILKRAHADIRSSDARFFFIYLSEMDMYLHTHCGEPEKLRDRLAWYESQLREIFATARARCPGANMSVFSDHGMTPVSNHYDVMSEIERTGLKTPDDYLAVYDSTMARFWFFSDEARARIAETLERIPCGRILPEAELKDLGVFFEDGRYGQLIFLLDPGYMLARSDFNGPQWMPAGMHGYHPGDAYSDAVFLSNANPTRPLSGIADVWHCMHEVIA
jgi:hypothetical protein